MKTYFPKILSAGLFDSSERFQNIKTSQPRKVNCYELELFLENGGYSVVNGDSYSVEKSNILFSKSGDVRFSHFPCKCIFFHFDSIPPELERRFNTVHPVFPAEDFQKIYNDFIKIIKLYCSADPVNNLCASAELFLLLKNISTAEIQENSIVAKAKKYIYANFSEDLSVEDVAEYCNISASYLHKIYSKAYGIGPSEALLNRRIYKAKELIISTNFPLSEISSRCGFNSQSYFSDCFKRKTGATPKEFRKNSEYFINK